MLQHGGNHYTSQSVQPIEYMRQCMTDEQFEGYLRGNAIKYLSRYDKKGTDIADLYKAVDYVTALLKHLEWRASK